MSRSSRVKYLFGSGTCFGILVNEVVDLKMGISVIPGNMLLFEFSLILMNRLVKLLKLGVLIPTISVGFRRIVFSSPNRSL
jgi:uncharacterized membrane protein YhaH (DUF805 family)